MTTTTVVSVAVTRCCLFNRFSSQVGVKVSGFAPRIAALESVLYMIIDQVKDLPKPVDANARKDAAQVCWCPYSTIQQFVLVFLFFSTIDRRSKGLKLKLAGESQARLVRLGVGRLTVKKGLSRL